FYTFQILAFTIDVHRKKVSKLVSLQEYIIFILFFPQLIAGPIMRSEEFLPKLDSPAITEDSMKDGLLLVMTGLLKKVVIADSIGGILNPVFASGEIIGS